MAKRNASADQVQFPFAIVPRTESDSVLKLVENEEPLGAAGLPRVRRLKRTPVALARGVDAQSLQVGAQLGELGAQTSSGESGQLVRAGRLDVQFSGRGDCYPSRIGRARLSLRVDRKLLKIIRKECGTVDPPLLLQDVTEDAWRLWLRERARARVDAQKLDAQTPTCSSSGSSGGLEDRNPDLDLTTTTTTTTVGVQTPKTVALPGFAAKVLEHQQHNSRYSEEMNLAYAWDMHRTGQGIKAPDVWALSNWRSGKKDELIDLWVKRKEAEAAAEEEKRERIQRQQEQSTRRRELKNEEQPSLWVSIVKVLRGRLNAEALNSWIAPVQCECVDEVERVIRLHAPNLVVKDWVTSNCGEMIAEALNGLKRPGFSISWTIGL